MNTSPWSTGGEVEHLVHPTAIIDPDANVAPGVAVGPYSIIGPGLWSDEARCSGHMCSWSGIRRLANSARSPRAPSLE